MKSENDLQVSNDSTSKASSSKSRLKYVKHRRFPLSSSTDYNEKWLQDRIFEDPSILGLGENMVPVDRERQQDKAGRLDLLFSDQEGGRRYEVEVMLGATDEAHIIRSLEYWDIERRRYPAYEHCAVLVAEDITSRFLNVVSLLSGTVPIVAIKINAISAEEILILDFVHVLDQRALRRDDSTEPKPIAADRKFWVDKSSEKMVKLAETILKYINESIETEQELNYTKAYIGLKSKDSSKSNNYIQLMPRKAFMRTVLRSYGRDEIVALFEEKEIEAEARDGNLVFTLSPDSHKKNEEFIKGHIAGAVKTQFS